MYGFVDDGRPSALGNRTSTQDLDYFIDPVIYGNEKIHVETALRAAIAEVGVRLQYDPKWCNDEVSLFLTLLSNPYDLFARSVEQNVILYQGHHLIVYAVLWKWVLVRKMKRLQMENQEQREEDLSDCIAILRIMTGNGERPLHAAELREFDDTEGEPPVLDSTIGQINDMYRQLTSRDAFVVG